MGFIRFNQVKKSPKTTQKPSGSKPRCTASYRTVFCNCSVPGRPAVHAVDRVHRAWGRPDGNQVDLVPCTRGRPGWDPVARVNCRLGLFGFFSFFFLLFEDLRGALGEPFWDLFEDLREDLGEPFWDLFEDLREDLGEPF